MGFRVPFVSPVKPSQQKTEDARWQMQERFTANLLEPLNNEVFKYGTTRLQGFDVPMPADANAGQALVWDATLRSFTYGNISPLTPTGVTPGTYGDSTHVGRFTVDVNGVLTAASNVAIAFPGTSGATGTAGSSTQVPVVTTVNGLVTVLGTATITGTVPDGTRTNQLLRWNGSAWVTFQGVDNIQFPVTSAFADQFDYTSTLGAQWNLDSGSAYATVNYRTTPSAGVTRVDVDSDPGLVLLQSAGDSTARGIWQDVTSLFNTGTNPAVVMWCEVNLGGHQQYATNDGLVQFGFENTAQTKFVRLRIKPDSGNLRVEFDSDLGNNVTNPGLVFSAINTQSPVSGPICLAIARDFGGAVSTWRAWVRVGRSRWYDISNGVTSSINDTFTVNRQFFRAENAATPCIVVGIGLVGANTTGLLPQGG